MASTVMQIRVDSEIKDKVSKLYNDLGLDLSTAVRLFFNKSLSVSNIPFDIANVSRDTKAGKKVKKYIANDLNKYIEIGRPLYSNISIEDYIKMLRRDRS